MISFSVSFEGREDADLPEKLKAEGSGILAWLVRGCLEYQRIGLAEPSAVSTATNGYKLEEDVIGRFVNDTCTLNRGLGERSSILFEAYSRWCKDSGESEWTQTGFSRRLIEMGFAKEKRRDGNYWGGLRLNFTLSGASVEGCGGVEANPRNFSSENPSYGTLHKNPPTLHNPPQEAILPWLDPLDPEREAIQAE